MAIARGAPGDLPRVRRSGFPGPRARRSRSPGPRRGEYLRAQAYYTESLSLRRRAGNAIATAQSLEDLGTLAGRMQQPERAARHPGAAGAFCETLGAHPPVAIATECEHAVAAGRVTLGEAAFAALWAEGRAMALEQAVEYALGDGCGR